MTPGGGFAARLRPFRTRASALPMSPVEGRLTRLVGLALEARGCHAAVGDRCLLLSNSGARAEAEVVGFSGDRLLLMPTGRADGLEPETRVVPSRRAGAVAVGDGLLGRIVDGAGLPHGNGRRVRGYAPRTP